MFTLFILCDLVSLERSEPEVLSERGTFWVEDEVVPIFQAEAEALAVEAKAIEVKAKTILLI